MKRWLVVTIALTTALLPAASACGDDDEKANPSPSDAAAADAPLDADPCASYSGVGTACNVPRTRICFPQCNTGGCFCENGKWVCVTDPTCFRDANFFEDVIVTPIPDASIDSPTDAGDSG